MHFKISITQGKVVVKKMEFMLNSLANAMQSEEYCSKFAKDMQITRNK